MCFSASLAGVLLVHLQGQQVPDAPPIPDFKPCFDRGLWLGCRDLAVATVRKVYEIIAVKRLGLEKADCLLRDHKLWIRDVLAFKHRYVGLAADLGLAGERGATLFSQHPVEWPLHAGWTLRQGASSSISFP
jgi:hypothetical protein